MPQNQQPYPFDQLVASVGSKMCVSLGGSQSITLNAVCAMQRGQDGSSEVDIKGHELASINGYRHTTDLPAGIAQLSGELLDSSVLGFQALIMIGSWLGHGNGKNWGP